MARRIGRSTRGPRLPEAREAGRQGGRYADAERRWRAGQQAGIVEFPCLVEAADQDTAFFEAYLANLHRDALAPVDAAVGLQHIRETFGLVGDDEVAAKLNKSVGWVRQMNAVLGLDPDARQTLQTRGEPVAVAGGLRPPSGEGGEGGRFQRFARFALCWPLVFVLTQALEIARGHLLPIPPTHRPPKPLRRFPPRRPRGRQARPAHRAHPRRPAGWISR